LKGRPNVFQHDDYHLRNLVFGEDSLAGVIDFGRHDWGDPVHEFLKVGQFSGEISIPFCVGQIRGYFGGKDPDEEFWALYSFYLAAASVSFVIWTRHVCPAEMPRTMAINERVMRDHDGFQRLVPKWYSSYGGR
jgi:aminoglycoside phosphotransferase (APT) family kinase protein